MVVDRGREVKDVAIGDEVVVHCGIACRHCYYCTRGEEFFCHDFKIWGFQTGPLDGAHGEYCKVPAVNVLAKPKNLTWEEAASMPLVLVTVWRMLVSRARMQAGDFVLVWGASGGLGVMAIQIAKLFNARPIAVASSDEKLELARKLGAEFVLNRTRDDIFAEVRRLTDGRRADIVFEHTGADTWPISMQCLKWGGTIVTCGATSGFDAHMDIRLLWNKQQNYLGSHLGNKGELIDAMRFVERGLVKPVIDRTMHAQGSRPGAGTDGDQRGGRQDRDVAGIKKKAFRGSDVNVQPANDSRENSLRAAASALWRSRPRLL